MGSRAAREAFSIQWKYHIFLSFRGEDTRNGFTSLLHKALQSWGYEVFMDENDLKIGQDIKPELLQAIEKSKMSVIVFSTRYADSSWCLHELVKIMECRRTLNQIVLPIFYNVDPSDFRHQTGTLASDFQEHTIRHKDEVVKEWRKALTAAANLCAAVLEDTADRDEEKFIEEFIENNIITRLSTTPLPVADHPVGVDTRVHDMINYLLGGGSQNVVMIGIWGMPGLGKTTAAKAIYNQIKDKFEAHGFLGDIRDTANRHGLVYLQQLLLYEINKKPTKFHISCVDGGKVVIKKELKCKRVLVIIDDVDENEQLEAIAGSRDWFGSGSRIIITTRDRQFLNVPHVNVTFTVPEMNPDEGLELFRRHAFENGYPNHRYLELSEKVVLYSGGLPLALKVLGSFLFRRTIAEWESQLQELEGIPPKGILKKLKISYDGLDHDEQCIFLDISCFFIGMNKDHVRKILDGCGFKAEIKISVLLQRCLVTVNEKNQLMMHNLLRDMGRAIGQEGDKEDRRRLWLREDVTDVLEDESGTKKVEGLALNLRSSEKASFSTEAFSKMSKLKLLQLNYVELTGEYKFLSKNLRWLCWHGFLLDSIPGDFDLTKLVALDLQFSKLKIVWKDCKSLKKLRIINLSHSSDLTTSPDFSEVPNLEELILEYTSLSDVHESIGDLKRLAFVNLEHCKMLKDLPLNLYRSKSIETLLLNGCSRFENLAEGLGDMVSLRTLEADDTAITKIPSSIVKLKNLRSLSLCGLERLTGFLPHSYLSSTGFLPPLLDGLNSLRKLALANCSLTDDELPKDLGSLSSLEHLDCGQNSFSRLPSLSGLSKLEYLCLNDCRALRAIPELPTNLKVLRGFGCTALETMPDFSEMSSIRELYLSDSNKLTEIPGLDKSLNSVTRIHMEGCTNLTARFRKKILQGWTSCGFGGIYLEGIYHIPKWFKLVGNEYNEVDFEVPQNFGYDLKGLTLCCVYSSDNPKPKDGLGIMVRNVTQGTTLHTWPAIASVKTDSKPEDDYLWQGQLSNDRLSLQVGDKVLLSVFATVDFVRVKNAAVNLEWDKVMKENMHDSDPHLYNFDPNPDWLSRTPDEAGPSQGEPLRESVLASCNLTDTEIYNDYSAYPVVGITSRVRDLSDHFEKSGSTDVRMIGILGMGGIGKTTLAKTIYNKFERIFEGRSFLANVREVIAHHPYGLVRLQEQLLNDILKSMNPIKVGSVDRGIDMIRKRLCCKRALIIIDDADDLQQLEAIAGARHWFGPGSRIVITTRDKHLLVQVGVDSTYMAQAMNEKEALVLFSWHAFKRGYTNQEYLDLSERAIRSCRGLPLALKVVGSVLFRRSTVEWVSHLKKLERSLDGDIQKILRITFDGLPDNSMRKIFLDISCFFIGMDKDYVTQILDGCDLFATIGISVLIERCLLTVSEQKKLMMHDLLQDMGREIVRENARGHPEKFSRLWKREDITNVLSDESGTEEIEGVALDLDLDLDLGLTRFSAQALTNMKKLRLLHLSNVELTGEYKDFPKKLTWLCWHGFPLESIPDEFPNQPKLVALDLQYSDLKIVWKDCKLHQKLKILNLSHSYQLKKSPDFSKLPNLEELILEDCFSLSEVHSSIGDLGRLSLVNLQGCIMLKDLPLNFYKSKSIETLLLNGCYWFENLAEGLGDMVSLTTLKADNTAIRQIPSSILKLKKLKALSLYNVNGSPSTYRLPPSLQSLSSLRELALEDCSLTGEAFPKDLGSLISLERLSLASNDFSSLASLSRLSELKYLSLYMCENLSAIPDLPTNLEVLQADGCIALEKMPDFSEMSNLRELSLGDSGKLTEIPGLNESLNSMTRIHMENCTNLTADFRKNILQGWTSCGFGGIFLSGNDIPDWFHYVHDDDIVYFTVPQSVGYNLKGLTLSFVYSSERFSLDSCIRICIKNMTKGTELDARITPVCPTKGYYLWQGQLSNNELKLLDGDKVLIEIIHEYDWAKVKVKKTGVRLVWDKFMNENMIDYHLCAYDRRPYLVNDDDIIHVEYDNHITKSPDFSQFPFLEKLILKGCEHLYKVHSSIGDLGRLSLVNLEGCNNLEDFPLNFYKSKSIKTLLLNRCSRFRNLADGLGDMVSLTILEANETRIRQIPSSIVKLKNLRILSLSGLRLTEDAIPKDLCSLISLERLLLGGNDFCSLPSLAGLSKLQVLCLNACGELLAIPDLPTNLHALKAIDCPALERIPDFSKMSNMRELYLSDSFKLTEVPGLDKSLNSMTRIHMEGCTNLILQHTSLQEQVMDTSTAIESSSPTSSSSSSVSLDDGTYDVFLSFRGEDTRKNFTDHLYWTLKDARVDVFIDENELRGGEIIPDELKQVIQRSRIAVVIFSRRYADSIKCLEELEKIMECRRTLGQIVLPIFYDVDPSDVRKQTGSFAKAFQTHEVCFHGVKDKEEKIQSWRKSLTEAASLEGRDFSNSYGYQGVFIRNIIDEIIQKLKSTCLDVATNQVGIESSKQEISNYVQVQVGIDSRVQEISTHLDVGGSNDVRIIGIWGMVGMGKTTVAEAIFNKYHPSFDAKSFLRSMRERKLVDLQEQLLFDIVKLTKVEGNNVGEMMDEIKRRLQRRKVLVILDDICHADQLKALAIERDSFGLGSRIVITTRSKHLLEIIEVDKICSLKEMNEVEALELLSWHAFKSRRPSEGYLELSREVVGYCGGLPLALKVLGSFLFKRSTTEWRNALDKWKTLPPKEIHEKLKLSYDELPDNYLRDTFLDISCFFIGMDMNYVMQILVRRGFSPVIGLSVLLEESLLTVGVDNKLMMHDLVRDMGREIVRAQSPNIPGERSRLWHHEDVKDVLRNKSGTEEIEALTLDFQESADPSFSTEAFRRMWRLRLLKLNYVQLTGSYKHFSKELRWLCWHGFPLEVIPKDFYQKNLVAIDMSYSKLIRVWEDSHLFLSELKSLVLSHSTCLKQLPDFSILPNLEELILRGCKSLLWDHDFMTQLDKLKLLDLGYCNLTEDEVLADLRRLRSLKILRLDGNGFKWLHFLRDLSELEELTLNDCKNLRRIRDLPVTLKFLKANYCTALETIEFFSHMSNVRELYLKDCSKLMYISDLDDSLHFMETIHMEGCTNLCAGLQKSVVEGWAASGGGGLFFSGSDIPSWFRAVVNGDEIVYIDVPNSGIGALTVCIIYSSDDSQSSGRLSLTFANRTQRTAFSIFPMTVSGVTPHEDYLWLGRIPNNVLNLKGGDKVHAQAEFLREEGKKHFKLKKTGVFLEEKEFVPEDCVYKMEWKSKPYTHPDTDDEAWPSKHSHNLVGEMRRLPPEFEDRLLQVPLWHGARKPRAPQGIGHKRKNI